ncbi:GDP-Man:Man(3)GlcNAc(2)-PP-Dol alpha-1,2-mannosyltransferase [Auxenochlorella protothecoides]|uniref:GDP-Man:Man(3)GlcNAc(2)-PP-Dol alpha-1,2-mannosyltransferase n=2 Tax=Auxenochlorella protothecoides TaxID=3075 RepID=A0A087SFK3_AUXPR|nr:GDP-Man:Man(3)GlcNAc(2)-PP-Dol alpha-1,2-mannosyltransferase [Auxenochlorella protothecoides]KFM24507.1 GDP-Man:Man(3)GlcNAc(2)-PP-Dol alpha-1,2-mannosyltransferase [Auxenochlorella protothecoides]
MPLLSLLGVGLVIVTLTVGLEFILLAASLLLLVLGVLVVLFKIWTLYKFPRPTKIALYVGGSLLPSELVSRVESQFQIRVEPTFTVIRLESREELLPARYPRFTMLRQALASVRVAFAGLRRRVPAVWLDTTGWAFPYPLASLLGCRVAAYVHYPTISSDMLARVAGREAAFNNDVGASTPATLAKVAYYGALAAAYSLCGLCAHTVMVNSSWTKRHISLLWLGHRDPFLVYPPCNTEALQELPLSRRLKRLYIVSVSQFRPEKQHALQLRAFARARRDAERLESDAGDAVLAARLELVGGCRNAEDAARIEELKALARELGLEGSVDFLVNLPFPELQALLGEAVVGLHTMRDEHFGIGIVEFMAAGVVPVVHDSGGPREDIVQPEGGGPGSGGATPTGFRCVTEEEYAAALTRVLGMQQLERLEVAAAARRRADRFSDARFAEAFMDAMAGCLPLRT